jgi:hypothetical protein
MRKLRSKFEGWPLENPPQNEDQRLIALECGFVELATGQWVRPPQTLGPSLEFIRRYPHGHTCHACKDSFRSKQTRDPYCISCDNIIRDRLKKLAGILQAALKLSPDTQRSAWEEAEKELTCPVCSWQANQNREESEDFAGFLENLPRRVERAHLHFMRHMFWNRFPYSRWFTPQISAAEKQSYFGRRDWLKKIEEEPISFVIGHAAEIEFEPLTTKTISLPLTRPAE